MITADALRARFAGTCLPEDPLAVAEPPGLLRWPRKMREQLEAPLTPAGVLVPVVERATGLSVLLTQRAAHLRAHAAQASFPGGRMEAQDVDVGATALRETHEEIGVAPDRVEVIGCLSTLPTITGFAVTPIVGLLEGGFELTIDRSEVEYTFELPLDFLLDESNDRLVEREWEGARFRLREFHYEGERVWGATAYMLQAFREFVLKQ
ncbi:MAG: CoA pyrophosphatase [Gammaproteobacteria bacterium]|nr:CoA pyrophosphatase [Gammaproteobacteria bacterium]NNF48502.1 CoA pyrophosphatase [Woeseiaceae bacterium]MBT8094896.1 CoA pyrophosphatase [Gammaproteobacteria bacterium]MBT8104720.1 CoA pyrophosphatase [Gammaproteobacteria bacterium]NNK24734.1 CoA pyrophosphatase [Woeseiaceae bacterium]